MSAPVLAASEAAFWAAEMAAENTAAIGAVFGRKHHAVIANPPYIVPPTAEARDAYRARYVAAAGQYGLGCPFTERLFELAVDGGFIAQITSNAFMKREHGKPLVESVLPHYDLTNVVDTSGAYIPGHGTPTVILVARNRPPQGDAVQVVMGRRGEPGVPEGVNPIGLVWAGRMAKLARELATAIAKAAKLDKADAAPIAAAWITGAGALRLFDALRALHGSSAPDASEHLGVAFERVAAELPSAEYWASDAGLNPCWRHTISDAWSARVRSEVAAVVDLRAIPRDQQGRTDWIGDLYQGLDDLVRKQHAFCQTPWFVTRFLADRALSPALAEFGDGATVIDPACGTGHLLCEAFQRLYLRRADPEDGGPEFIYPTCARMALDQVHGADLNPVAAALCRWRLTIAYLMAAQPRHFGLVPDDLPVHVATGDALLIGREPTRIDHSKRWPAPEAPKPLPPRGQLSLFGEAVPRG